MLILSCINSCNAYFGGDSLSKVVDETGKALAFNQLGASQIWSNYVRYIGAGAVAAGGLISLIKTFPTMIKTFGHAMKGFGKKGDSQLRTQQDISMKVVLGGILIIAVLIWLLPEIPVSFLGAVMIVVFGFFFATVSSRMVGIVGSSNNPVSGMANRDTDRNNIYLKSNWEYRSSRYGISNFYWYCYLYRSSYGRRYFTGLKDRLYRRCDT